MLWLLDGEVDELGAVGRLNRAMRFSFVCDTLYRFEPCVDSCT